MREQCDPKKSSSLCTFISIVWQFYVSKYCLNIFSYKVYATKSNRCQVIFIYMYILKTAKIYYVGFMITSIKVLKKVRKILKILSINICFNLKIHHMVKLPLLFLASATIATLALGKLIYRVFATL